MDGILEVAKVCFVNQMPNQIFVLQRGQMKVLLICLSTIFFLAKTHSDAATHIVTMETTYGKFVIELDSVKAPITVANFLKYINAKFYEGTVFHRVAINFVDQAGGISDKGVQKKPYADIRNEAFNRLKNVRGSIAMGRESAPHTANSHFYFNVKTNTNLDFVDSSSNTRWGYCVFGKILTGLNVMDSINKAKVVSENPVIPIYILKTTDSIANVTSITQYSSPSSSISLQNGKLSLFQASQDQEMKLTLYSSSGKMLAAKKEIRFSTTTMSLTHLDGPIFFRMEEGKKITSGMLMNLH